MTGRIAILWAGTLLVALGLLLWWMTRPGPLVPPDGIAPEDRMTYRAVPFIALDGWAVDDHGAALNAFLRSCERFAKWPKQRSLGGRDRIGGSAADWLDVCRRAGGVTVAKPGLARHFFEQNFRAFAINHGGQKNGLFTGYYEPELNGSRSRQGPYTTPLYGLPKDLVKVDLGEFSESLKGKRIVGRLTHDGVGDRLRPYYERDQIAAGALAGRGLELVFVDDPTDAFFLHIQGSGRVRLDDGGEMRLGYAGGNGRRYYAIGRELIKRGILTRENVSMQSIRAWLSNNPATGRALMEMNPSFIFFRELVGPGPLGAMGAPLTPGRSIAVDRGLMPLGAPIWLQSSHPGVDPDQAAHSLNRLLIAQDTGGAIKGGVRGDVFWGHGADAAAIAGRMKNAGRWFLLLPIPVADRL